jgi:hypothetical protein
MKELGQVHGLPPQCGVNATIDLLARINPPFILLPPPLRRP